MGLIPPILRKLLRKRNFLIFILFYIILKQTVLHEDSYIMRGGPRPSPIDLYPYDHDEVKFLPYDYLERFSSVINSKKNGNTDVKIQWNKYAYVTYATDPNYLCNAIMNLARLKDAEALRSGNGKNSDFGSITTKADLVLLYRSDFRYIEGKPRSEQTSIEGQLLADAVDKFGIKVKGVPVLWFESDISSWSQSFTKFWIFDQIEYERLIYFDSDSRILQKMDELFFLPESIVYMPVSYQNFQVGLTRFLKYPYKNEKLMDVSERYEYINTLSAPLGEFLSTNEFDTASDKLFKSKIYKSLPSMKNFFSYLTESDKLSSASSLGKDSNGKSKIKKSKEGKLDYDVEIESLSSKFKLSDHIMVVKPDHKLFKSLLSFTSYKKKDEYDMDVLNNFIDIFSLFDSNTKKKSPKNEWLIASNKYDVPDKYIPLITILPHQNLGLLSGEFRKEKPEDHDYYLADVVDYPQIRYFQNEYRKYIDELGEYERQKRKLIMKEEASEEEVLSIIGYPPRELKIPYWSNVVSSNSNSFSLTDEGISIEEEFGYGWHVNSSINNFKMIHYSDYPIPKPWKIQYPDENRESRVMCRDNGNPEDKRFSVAGYKVLNDCDSVRFWNDLYTEFASDRLKYCQLELVP